MKIALSAAGALLTLLIVGCASKTGSQRPTAAETVSLAAQRRVQPIWTERGEKASKTACQPEIQVGSLVWPQWLVPLELPRLHPAIRVDRWARRSLEAQFATSQPLSAVYLFYGELLRDHGYRIEVATLREQEGAARVGHIEAVDDRMVVEVSLGPMGQDKQSRVLIGLRSLRPVPTSD